MSFEIFARRALLGSAAFVALAASPAPAQTAAQPAAQPAAQAGAEAEAAAQPPAPEATGAADDQGQDTATTDIVVTARRVEESLQRVPASVSAFNARALDRIQATDTTGLQGAVPNLNIVQGRGSSNATNIFIRGIGQPDALQTFDPAVGVYVDDVYYSRIRGTQLDLLDLERIEVLRGPQGTLYGKNTIGGALKLISRRPGKDFRANGTIAIGSYDQLEVKTALSGPIAPGVSAGFAVMKSMRDGFVKDEVLDRRYNDKDTTAVRGSLALDPASNIRIDLTGDWTQDHGALNVGQPLNSLTTLFGAPLLALPLNPDPDDYDFKGRTTPGLPNSTRLKHRGLALNAAIDLSDAITLRSITGLRKLDTEDYIDIDATQLETGDVFVDVNQKQFSQELQLVAKLGRFSGVAGLYFMKEDVGSHQEAYADDLIGSGITFMRTVDDDLTTRSKAAFVNGSYEIVDGVRLSGGIRFTREKKSYDRTTSTFSNFAAFRGTFVFAPDPYTWKDTSPMASIDWQATRDVMLYARFAKGFKSGGFNGRANRVSEATRYEPETVRSYEAGFKSRFASKLTLNGAIFTNDYKDFQARVSGTELDDNGNPLPVLSVLNAGKLRIRGAELEAAWSPLAGLLLDSQIGYLDADYKKFADLRFPGGSRAFQTPAFAPKWTLRFGAQYGFELGSSGSLTLGAQARYRSRTALAVDNTYIFGATGTTTEVDGLFQPGYWLADGRIVWENTSKQFAVGLYGNNLFDQRYKTDGQDFSSIGSIRTVYFGNPRTVTLRLTARY